jgi:two-component system response regulator
MTTHADRVEILLVEDNPSDEELTLHAFKTNHILNRMQVVRDGAQALDFVFARGAYSSNTVEKGPKLILLDVKLPKVDGLEVLRQIKDDPRTRDIPVVVLTSSQEEPDLTAAYDRGANSYIVKPVNFEQFSELMRKVGVYWLLLNKLPLRLGWAGDRN